jgi:hypothetical protein
MKALFQSFEPERKKAFGVSWNGPGGSVVVVVVSGTVTVGSVDASPGSPRRLVVVNCSDDVVDDPFNGETVVPHAATRSTKPTTVAAVFLLTMPIRCRGGAMRVTRRDHRSQISFESDF